MAPPPDVDVNYAPLAYGSRALPKLVSVPQLPLWDEWSLRHAFDGASHFLGLLERRAQRQGAYYKAEGVKYPDATPTFA